MTSQHDRDSRELRELCAQRDAARATVRQQAERIAELEAKIADLHTTMMAAAVEIHEHWDAHCDAEGYGPANLMHRLERGIASQYGYDAKTLQRVESERDQLRAEVERLRPNAERWEYALNSEEFAICQWGSVFGELCWVPISEESAIDAARTHKETP